jgi:hypothetical protein
MNGYNNRSRLADAELDEGELFNEGKFPVCFLYFALQIHFYSDLLLYQSFFLRP